MVVGFRSDILSFDENLHGSFEDIVEVENKSVHDEVSKVFVLLNKHLFQAR